ncbi:MAG: hypothetical protein V1722_01160 [Candidatus Micrarchaeota archaeon]
MADQDFYYQLLGKEQYPAVPVTIYFVENATPTYTIIDSGADYCLFNNELADDLKLEIETGRQISLNGIGGKIVAFLHEVQIQLLNRKITCKALFSRDFKWQANILGRAGFFEAHEITFKEKDKIIQVKEVD